MPLDHDRSYEVEYDEAKCLKMYYVKSDAQRCRHCISYMDQDDQFVGFNLESQDCNEMNFLQNAMLLSLCFSRFSFWLSARLTVV